jgi:FG-GAP repeat
MTLKSFNTRYVKLIRNLVVISVSLLSLTVTLNTSGAAPLFERKLTARDGGFGEEFGHAVAVSGSTLVVGARADRIGFNPDQGSAYVFNREAGGWTEHQKLIASDGAVSDQFGWSVAVSGSTIVVGAWVDDVGSNSDQGSAYVFTLHDGSWVQTQKLTASDGAARDLFGWSVAVSGSTIIVGAIGDDLFSGAVYVFNRQGGSWIETQKLTAGGVEFGYSLALSGSTLVIGSISSDSFEGAAYVFNREGADWVETQKLTASDGATFDLFGWSVALSGSTLVVSARGDTVGANFDQGSVYVFNHRGGKWFEQQKLTASDGAPIDEFGVKVAISGSTIVVGSPGDDIGGNSAQGSAYLFNRHGGSWVEDEKLTASDGGALEFFGNAVALSGSTVVVGAVSDAIGGNSFQGSVYIFEQLN